MRPSDRHHLPPGRGFQSTHSLRSATNSYPFNKNRRTVSIHALLAECDARPVDHITGIFRFNPRTPCGVRLFPRRGRFLLAGFNPRTPCGVRPVQGGRVRFEMEFQSTHSLRSATFLSARCTLPKTGFNPRTPCGVRLLPSRLIWLTAKFQSTHSLRSATGGQHVLPACFSGFNPRTPCGVRLRPTLYIATQQSKSYFAPTSLKRPSLHGCSF